MIFFDNASDEYPLLGMYFNNEEWMPMRWTKSGRFSDSGFSDLDLINSPASGKDNGIKWEDA